MARTITALDAALDVLAEAEGDLVSAYDAHLAAATRSAQASLAYERAAHRALAEGGAAARAGTLPEGATYAALAPGNLDPHRSLAVHGRRVSLLDNVPGRLVAGAVSSALVRAGVHPSRPGVAPLGESFVDGLRGNG